MLITEGKPMPISGLSKALEAYLCDGHVYLWHPRWKVHAYVCEHRTPFVTEWNAKFAAERIKGYIRDMKRLRR